VFCAPHRVGSLSTPVRSPIRCSRKARRGPSNPSNGRPGRLKLTSPQIVYIMKPVGKAQGKGIFLFTKLSQISDWKKDHRWKSENPQAENYIVQRYIDNPYLVGGKKFDMRIYAMVVSYAPLKVRPYCNAKG
jgi:hypothetical protein